MKFCLEISFFFGPLIGVLEGDQSRKSEDFDRNTKNGLRSSVFGFINRETAQNDHDKILYMILVRLP